jgi:signal transduction histidine kinase
LRHDVIKHRTSALGLLAQTPDALPKIRSTILEPIPTSEVVAEAYIRLAAAARAEGVRLRRLAREPNFGRLAADLRAIERALREGTDVDKLLRLDERLRTLHRDGLQQLLSSGPRCHLDAVQIQAWIAALQAEFAGKKQAWTVPALQMSDLSLALPVDGAAVFQIFANLLRNAQAAVHGCEDPKLLVRVVRQTDPTGQAWVKLQIGDNAMGELSSEDIESQVPGRGLGIVRDTARDWNGHVVIAPESEPYRKTVGVEFAV